MGDGTWIVVPCFNEALRLDVEAFARALAAPVGPAFLLVDDGSTDGTGELLRGLQEGARGVCRVLTLPRNRGKAEAVRAGLAAALAAGADRVGYWDADLATPLEAIADFSRILDEKPGVEVVMGARVRLLGRRIERSAFRHYAGRVYATAASLALGLPVYDTQCGAKLFRRSRALSAAIARPFRSRWAFDVELLRRLQDAWGDAGLGRILELALAEWRDVGESKVSLVEGARAGLFVAALAIRRAFHARRFAAPSPVDELPVPRLAEAAGER